MKNCDEIVHDLLDRREEYMKLKEKRKTKLLICLVTLCSYTVILMIGFHIFGKENSIENDMEGEAYINHTSNSDLSNKNENDDTDEKEKYAVYTDKVMLPENTDENVSYDLVACLYYKGIVYTQSGFYSGEKLEKVKKILGEKVGEAKGNINEWSEQEDWATEFASTVSGSVYKAKGYSEDFRLLVYYDDNESEYIHVLDNYNGIGLNTGSDLFEKRMHLTGNIKTVKYQTHEDWNADWDGKEEEEKNSFKKLDITEEEWNKFIEKLYQSPFEKIDYYEDEDFYDTELQGHLYLEMEDGLEVGIRLIDGGYVGCSSLGWYFVKMPGKIFDKVMEACQI